MRYNKYVAALPKDFKASIFIVQHVSPDSVSLLPRILSYMGNLKAVHPAIEQGTIYLAAPDRHLLIEGDRILVKKGPKENRFRPSIDALFRSAAYTYGARVIGVILTGMLDDGTSGMWTVKCLGGLGIIQQPDDAAYPSMPKSVLDNVNVDHVVPLSQIGPLLTELTQHPASNPEIPMLPEKDRIKSEIDIAAQKNAFEMGVMKLGHLSPLTCPDCKGVLIRIKEGNLYRYRCHTGHSFHFNSLLEGLTESVEMKLWEAVKSLEETVLLLEETAVESLKMNDEITVLDLQEKANVARERAKTLHRFIFEM